MALIKVQLVQKPHAQDFPYYQGAGLYYGVQCEQVGDDLVATVEEDAIQSLLDAKKFKKLSANAFKELKSEAEK